MKTNTISQREKQTGWLLIIPALIILALVFIYPIGRAFWLSFYSQNLGTELEAIFSGFSNYQRMVGDGRFWQSLAHTIIFTSISIPLELILGLIFALILNQSFVGRGFVRTVALIPWALPTAVMGVAWTWIFNDQYGVINDILLRFGIITEAITWLGEPTKAMFSLIIADVWKTTPFVTLILLAGLQSIAQDLYEAHAIDGATPWQSFRAITLPLLAPQIFIAFLFRFAQCFGVFDLIQVMTGGGPAGATEMVAIYLYSTVRRYLDFGYGATLVTVTFFLLILAIGIIYILLSKTPINISGER
ncbi:MAG: carbohydrate ABC transporter permease [Xenococcus sp. (in: cyanobacteria)]